MLVHNNTSNSVLYIVLCSTVSQKFYANIGALNCPVMTGRYLRGVPPLGGPPGAPGASQGSPGVLEFWKKFQKFPKII